ncbi:restriction endonuclease subunit S [Kyrpidia tusciae]|uniref:restriction endonuclease subunit S n=1 Tax=Kyrpidia tusciae TaxID=33943 RepID=UPI0002E64166|nr:restriction endonuclease subunit S [Kyrpidia tusciae]
MSSYLYVKLGDIFNLNTETVCPRELPSQVFVHYSIPAFDESHRPVLERGWNIKSNKYALKGDSLLVSKLNPRINRVWKFLSMSNPNPSVCSTEFMVYQTIRPDVDLDFYYHFFTSHLFQAALMTLQSGTTGSRMRVTPKETLNIRIPYPPFREQRKIAAILTSVDDAIAATQRIIDQTERVKRGLMQQLLTRGIGHTKFKQTEIGEIPAEWDVMSFRDACEIVNGQVDPKEAPYCDMIHIAPNHIVGFIGHLEGYTTAKEDCVTSGKYLFTEEHVLFSKIRPELGKVAYPGFSGICSADIYPIRARNGIMLPEFLKYVLMSDRFYRYSISVSGRTGIPKVNRHDLDCYQIAVPPIAEQEGMCKILRSVYSYWSANLAKKSSLMTLKSALMQVLLTGKIRVKVDEEAGTVV